MQLEHNVVIHRQGYNADKRDAYAAMSKRSVIPTMKSKSFLKTHYIVLLKHKKTMVMGRHLYQMHCPISMVYLNIEKPSRLNIL